jgi:hypothetical protein
VSGTAESLRKAFGIPSEADLEASFLARQELASRLEGYVRALRDLFQAKADAAGGPESYLRMLRESLAGEQQLGLQQLEAFLSIRERGLESWLLEGFAPGTRPEEDHRFERLVEAASLAEAGLWLDEGHARLLSAKTAEHIFALEVKALGDRVREDTASAEEAAAFERVKGPFGVLSAGGFILCGAPGMEDELGRLKAIHGQGAALARRMKEARKALEGFLAQRQARGLVDGLTPALRDFLEADRSWEKIPEKERGLLLAALKPRSGLVRRVKLLMDPARRRHLEGLRLAGWMIDRPEVESFSVHPAVDGLAEVDEAVGRFAGAYRRAKLRDLAVRSGWAVKLLMKPGLGNEVWSFGGGQVLADSLGSLLVKKPESFEGVRLVRREDGGLAYREGRFDALLRPAPGFFDEGTAGPSGLKKWRRRGTLAPGTDGAPAFSGEAAFGEGEGPGGLVEVWKDGRPVSRVSTGPDGIQRRQAVSFEPFAFLRTGVETAKVVRDEGGGVVSREVVLEESGPGGRRTVTYRFSGDLRRPSSVTTSASGRLDWTQWQSQSLTHNGGAFEGSVEQTVLYDPAGRETRRLLRVRRESFSEDLEFRNRVFDNPFYRFRRWDDGRCLVWFGAERRSALLEGDFGLLGPGGSLFAREYDKRSGEREILYVVEPDGAVVGYLNKDRTSPVSLNVLFRDAFGNVFIRPKEAVDLEAELWKRSSAAMAAEGRWDKWGWEWGAWGAGKAAAPFATAFEGIGGAFAMAESLPTVVAGSAIEMAGRLSGDEGLQAAGDLTRIDGFRGLFNNPVARGDVRLLLSAPPDPEEWKRLRDRALQPKTALAGSIDAARNEEEALRQGYDPRLLGAGEVSAFGRDKGLWEVMGDRRNEWEADSPALANSVYFLAKAADTGLQLAAFGGGSKLVGQGLGAALAGTKAGYLAPIAFNQAQTLVFMPHFIGGNLQHFEKAWSEGGLEAVHFAVEFGATVVGMRLAGSAVEVTPKGEVRVPHAGPGLKAALLWRPVVGKDGPATEYGAAAMLGEAGKLAGAMAAASLVKGIIGEEAGYAAAAAPVALGLAVHGARAEHRQHKALEEASREPDSRPEPRFSGPGPVRPGAAGVQGLVSRLPKAVDIPEPLRRDYGGYLSRLQGLVSQGLSKEARHVAELCTRFLSANKLPGADAASSLDRMLSSVPDNPGLIKHGQAIAGVRRLELLGRHADALTLARNRAQGLRSGSGAGPEEYLAASALEAMARRIQEQNSARSRSSALAREVHPSRLARELILDAKNGTAEVAGNLSPYQSGKQGNIPDCLVHSAWNSPDPRMRAIKRSMSYREFRTLIEDMVSAARGSGQPRVDYLQGEIATLSEMAGALRKLGFELREVGHVLDTDRGLFDFIKKNGPLLTVVGWTDANAEPGTHAVVLPAAKIDASGRGTFYIVDSHRSGAAPFGMDVLKLGGATFRTLHCDLPVPEVLANVQAERQLHAARGRRAHDPAAPALLSGEGLVEAVHKLYTESPRHTGGELHPSLRLGEPAARPDRLPGSPGYARGKAAGPEPELTPVQQRAYAELIARLRRPGTDATMEKALVEWAVLHGNVSRRAWGQSKASFERYLDGNPDVAARKGRGLTKADYLRYLELRPSGPTRMDKLAVAQYMAQGTSASNVDALVRGISNLQRMAQEAGSAPAPQGTAPAEALPASGPPAPPRAAGPAPAKAAPAAGEIVYLDSNILMEVGRGNPLAVERLDRLIGQGKDVRVTTTHLGELSRGESGYVELVEMIREGKIRVSSPVDGLSDRSVSDHQALVKVLLRFDIGSKKGKAGTFGGDAELVAGLMLRQARGEGGTLVTAEKKLTNQLLQLSKPPKSGQKSAFQRALEDAGLGGYLLPKVERWVMPQAGAGSAQAEGAP